MAGALVCRSTADIEVHELHNGYLRMLKARGGATTTGAKVVSLEKRSNGWWIRTETETLHANIVVNAAGAWAGEIGRIAGAADIGLEPLRRTAILVAPPDGMDVRSWALLLDVDETFYLKPDAGLLLVSPADETPTVPCDAQPEELDIAIAVERVEQATTLQIKHVRHKWAGLRSFVRDRTPVVGYDPSQAGFFWMAALGGYGIQTAPSLSSLASSLVLDRPISEPIDVFEIDLAALSPKRFEGEFRDDGSFDTYIGGRRAR
jgi:D-arginine dehydrogenase